MSTELDPNVSKSEAAYQWIRERIVSQDFTPGYRLILGSIAGQLAMSVVPVREATRRLEAEGLVTFERNIGAYVRMVDDTGYLDSMAALAVLEGAATAQSAPYLTKKNLECARETNLKMLETLKNFDPRSFTLLNQKFHTCLTIGCQNARLLELVETEWTRLGSMRDSTFTFVPGRAQESVDEHEQILDLISNNAESTEIEMAVRRHRTATLEAYLNQQHVNETVKQAAS